MKRLRVPSIRLPSPLTLCGWTAMILLSLPETHDSMVTIQYWADENAIGLVGYAAWVSQDHEIRAFSTTAGGAVAGVEAAIERHNRSPEAQYLLNPDPLQHRVEEIPRPDDSPYSGDGLRKYREQLEHHQGVR